MSRAIAARTRRQRSSDAADRAGARGCSPSRSGARQRRRHRLPPPMPPPTPRWRSGLNIVVGFAGLLDLGYAAFFAIGAYAYGILTVVPGHAALVARSGSRSPGSAWSQRIHAGAAATWCISPSRSGSCCRSAALIAAVLRRAVRRADAAAARRLPGDRHARLRRDRADRGAQRRLASPTAPPG